MPSLFRRSDKPGVRSIRLLQAADFHGSNAAFRKFMSAIKQHGAQHAIITGDLTGKAIVPIIRENGRYVGWLFGNREVLETDAELARFKQKVGDCGMYDHVCDAVEAAALEADPDALHALFVDKMNSRLSEWLDFAGEYLAPLGVPLWVIPGNDDDGSVDPILDASQYARNVDHQVVELDEFHELVSLGDTSMTPGSARATIPNPTWCRPSRASSSRCATRPGPS